MKLKEFFYRLGFKPKPRRYGYEVREQTLEGRAVRYAQWLHPQAYACEVQSAEVARLGEFLSPGDVAIDIGAHIGDTALPMALCVGSKGCVLAFEPNGYVFETLAVNAGLNPESTNIKAYPFAITEENRDYEFSYCDPGFVNGGAVEKTHHLRRGAAYRQTVRGVRLTEFLQAHHAELIDRIRYIKVDTEGYDLYVLQSIAGLLDRVRPIIQAEVMKRTDRKYRLELYDFLSARGYAVHFHQNGLNETQPMARLAMLAHESFDIFCVPGNAAMRLARAG